MSSIHLKRAFTTGLNYLDNLQLNGEANGALRMFNRRFQFGKSLYSKDLYAHFGCVNAIEFSNDGEWLVSGGDDKRVLIWNIDKTLSNSRQPKAMKGEHNSNIFCLGFNCSNSKLFSAGNDEQVIQHDVSTGEVLDVFLHDEAIYGLSVDPGNENIFASACDDGRILVWDARSASNEPFVLDICASAYHAVMYNPAEPRFLATANAKDGVCLWDIRKPKEHYIKYGPTLLSQSAMSVRFNSAGTHLLALRRRFPPVLYEITSTQPTAEFDHNEYYNSCTMKSCCFAGDEDQFILSGSDDFKLYVWQIPDCTQSKKGMMVNKAHFILKGHRSIVNQVRYNSTYGMLASSGVEKIIKLWSTFPLAYQDTSSYVSSKDCLRKVYSHEEYVNLVLESGQFMSHDYSHHSVQEDPRMMAFFDSLVQRDIEGGTSDSSDTSDALNISYEVQLSDSSSTSSITSPDDDGIRAKENTLLHALKIAAGEVMEDRAQEDSAIQSVDRISKLIARKRKEQLIKAQRSLVQMEKKNKKRKRTISSQTSYRFLRTNTEEQLDEKIALSDKRKLLRKRRAKLSQATLLDETSSDSDDNAESRKVNNGTEKAAHQIASTSALLIGSNSIECLSTRSSGSSIPNESLVVSETSISNGFMSCVNGKLENNFGGMEKNGSKSADNNGIKDIEHSNDTDSKPTSLFTLKSRKHNGRNYRKRGADELDD